MTERPGELLPLDAYADGVALGVETRDRAHFARVASDRPRRDQLREQGCDRREQVHEQRPWRDEVNRGNTLAPYVVTSRKTSGKPRRLFVMRVHRPTDLRRLRCHSRLAEGSDVAQKNIERDRPRQTFSYKPSSNKYGFQDGFLRHYALHIRAVTALNKVIATSLDGVRG